MRIAILSDIHEGINRKNTKADIIELLKEWITDQSPDVFVISGDMTAGPEKSLPLLNQLQNHCPHTKVLYVHGNHDIYHEDSTIAYETLLQFPGNLGNGPVKLDDNWVIIGDGGWYDYTFGIAGFNEEQFRLGTFNQFTWPDKTYANWPNCDQDETERYLTKIEHWLKKFQGKNIIMVTHVVPFSQFLLCKGDPSWDFFNAMMGSSQFGELAIKYGVKKYIFGHIHTRYHEQYKGIEIICNPLGYYPHEWSFKTAKEEIFSTIRVIEI
ncbi:putative phosphoesterase [Oikeobacillus pervagus]|uniref:Phosphoesterase n=1 Tax=Oikeobacillus pervagus TaxID=1325931 RepID=A0AAJ1SZ45_9BACI|nr:metallophosphoesterase [Oikeobacillus pervagus]MDQ0213956.1 putative phosphoesterase [Oikeobacillus pervagus]